MKNNTIMKKIFFLFLFPGFYGLAQTCQTNYIIPSGSYNVPLTHSTSWIKSQSATTIASGSEVKLDASPSGGYIELNAGFYSAPTGSGKFIAQVLDGCGALIPAKTPNNQADKSSLATETKFGDNDVSIYPNPSNGLFYVKTSNLKSGVIKIYNILGKQLLEKPFEKNSITEINLDNQAAQVFVVNIISDDQTIIRKIVKK